MCCTATKWARSKPSLASASFHAMTAAGWRSPLAIGTSTDPTRDEGDDMPGQVAPLTDERELLLAYVNQQRDGIRNAAYGLTDEQARLTPTAGSLSIGGLIKHVTAMEWTWVDLVAQRDRRGSAEQQESDYMDAF